MKLIRQITLYSGQGDSQQTFFIELCDVGGNACVVNFRVTSRSGKIQEGTTTVVPVARAIAERTFDELVNSKLAAGYSQIPYAGTDAVKLSRSQAETARSAAILTRLRDALEDGQTARTKWKLSRVIWRAGELKLTEAAPYLLRLANQGDAMQQYCAAWALSRCADESNATDAIRVLGHIYSQDATPDKVRRIAAAGLARLLNYSDDATFYNALLATLPDDIRAAVEQADSTALSERLRYYLFTLKTASNTYLTTLYLLSQKYGAIREPLLTLLSELSFAPGYFQPIRQILKAAELYDDAEMFGLLAYRIEKTAHGYRSPSGYGFRRHGSAHIRGVGYVKVKEEYQQTLPRLAFSSKTRDYLRERMARTLRRAGEADSPAYAKLAARLLLMYDDGTDMTKPYFIPRYRYEYRPYRRIDISTHYDSYATNLAFNFVLYANSRRYRHEPNAGAWHCVAPYQPGQPAPDAREEAFPALWDKTPQTLVELLLKSRCGRVQEFAAKAFRANPDHAKLLDISHLIALLALPYPATNALALDIAAQRYTPGKPDFALVHALLNCPYQPAREMARRWIEKSAATFMQDAAFVCDLICSSYADGREWARAFLPAQHVFELQEQAIVSRALAMLVAAKSDELANEAVQEIGDILLLAFPRSMYRLGFEVIGDLLAHSSAELHALAGKILLKHTRDARMMPDKFFAALLQSPLPQARSIGVQLLGKLPDYQLLEKQSLLMNFCISEFPEIRQAAKPLIGRLANSQKAFGDALAQLLFSAMLFKEAAGGIHQDVYALLTEELRPHLALFDADKAVKLLKSPHLHATLLGAYLLKNVVEIGAFSARQIIELAKNELRDVREAAWNFYRRYPAQIKQDAAVALGIVDSDWEDSRRFAFDYFRATFTENDWTPELLVSLCDSVRDDVRAFGREMITRFFREADGTDYLLKLSQHPSADLQLFATHYLEQFAANHADRIEKLEPYFVTMLSQVNKGRVAKTRIFSFLRAEAEKDEAAARVAARILTRQSATCAIRDKAACIEALRAIRNRFPQIDTPLKAVEPPI
ncbi:putative WGR protein [Candidatus Moduliflexus flocculans]|uniref:Putative WGR protein n=1 Tax=Candidatus Moduliflexus flocculans TaxID=1499966 RepID=A0A0S6VPR8_9BACT|nr:putative WGR protein [Candidatus Moduliflexus flocculans]